LGIHVNMIQERHLPVYYINLASRPDRRAFMEEQFVRLGIAAERIEAVTSVEVEEAKRGVDRDTLFGAELACALSHQRAWRLMLERGQAAALILEDDVILGASVKSVLSSRLVEELAAGVLRIERSPRNVALGRTRGVIGRFAARTLLSTDYGSAAYVISDWLARRALLDRRIDRMSIDGYLFMRGSPIFPSRHILQLDPAPAQQLYHSREAVSAADSDLATDRGRRLGQRRSWFTRLRTAIRDIPYGARATILTLREGDPNHRRRRVVEFDLDP
jgi:glycosyl transferase, family 25